VRIKPSFVQAELPAAHLFEKELTDSLFSLELAGRVVGNALVGKQVREIIPQAQFGVVPVGVLQALDRTDRLDVLYARLQSVDSSPQHSKPGALARVLRRCAHAPRHHCERKAYYPRGGRMSAELP